MKTKFAKEKSEYSHLIMELITHDLDPLTEYDIVIDKIKDVEKRVKDQGDELIFVVTTRDTNPMKEKTAPPMSEKDIKA